MFLINRKAEWFRPHIIGWGISPRTWQGFVYGIIWALVLLVPVFAIVFAQEWFAGSLLFTVLISYLIKDVGSILAEIDAGKTG